MSLRQDLKNHYAIFVVAGGFLIIMLIAIAFKSYVLKIIPPSASPMSEAKIEAKSEPAIKSPVLDEALKNQAEDEKVEVLIEKLRKENIKISVFIDNATAIKFLNELLVDKDSQKIFRYFSKKGVGIYLHERYRISGGLVFIDAKDSPKKAAKWLATGKT